MLIITWESDMIGFLRSNITYCDDSPACPLLVTVVMSCLNASSAARPTSRRSVLRGGFNTHIRRCRSRSSQNTRIHFLTVFSPLSSSSSFVLKNQEPRPPVLGDTKLFRFFILWINGEDTLLSKVRLAEEIHEAKNCLTIRVIPVFEREGASSVFRNIRV